MSTTAHAVHTAIEKANCILLVTHISPDGDALGSIIGMGAVLLDAGKQVSLVCDSDIPARFGFLPLVEKIQKRPKSLPYDLVIVLDCGDETRMGARVFKDLQSLKLPILNIDHHVTNNLFGTTNFVVSTAASTTEILYNLFIETGYPITQQVAMGLLTGIVTDTLGFRTNSTGAETLRIAGNLVEAGADLGLITMQTLNIKPLSTLKLWQIGLSHMRLEDGLIWVSISNDQREAIGHMSDSSSGLVNLLADLDRAAMSAVLLEMADGTVRVGFRCRPPYHVADLAANLGGGGHALASGCTMSGPLSKAEAIVVEMCKIAIHDQTVASQNGRISSHDDIDIGY